MQPTDSHPTMTRRAVMAAGTALSVSTLAACGSDTEDPASSGEPAPTSSGTAGAGGATDGGAAASGGLAALADVPVGGAVAAEGPDGKPVIVAQPTKGEVVAFSAICTHQGCTVAPAGKILQCPCHGSTYDLATGKNTGGPAPRPLTEIAVTVKDGEVVPA